MKIGVHLPNGVPGVAGETILEWARRADDSPLSCVAVADRLVYANVDPMVALSAAAGCTRRVELFANVFIAPLRNPRVFAKEVASLSLLAPGRLTVGVAGGARPYEYEEAGIPWRGRGRVIDEALDVLSAMREPEDFPQSIGPRPAEFRVVVGGASPPALARLVRHGHGYVSGGLQPKIFGFEAQAVKEAWAAAGREGQPRIVAGTWAASDRHYDTASAWRDAYLLKGGPPEFVRAPISRGADEVGAAIEEFAAQGASEVVFFLGTDDPSELDWLLDAVGPVISTG